MMPLRSLAVSGYRSIRRLNLRLGPLNVIVGPNGCGKTNLYQSLRLLTAAAEGRLALTIAAEGGMPSVLWAGPFIRQPKRVKVEVGFDDWTYQFECGLEGSGKMSMFDLDPMVRREVVSLHATGRPVDLFFRDNQSVSGRDEQGRLARLDIEAASNESMLSELREPHLYPELSTLRSVLLSWRFYHHFRTDADSPLRRPQVAVRSPVLSDDGANLASAIATIKEVGDHPALHAAVADAFDGGQLRVSGSSAGLEVKLATSEFQRGFAARELSDGTLKYLCLLAALLSPRPPTLLAFNEPDAALHPRLYEPLARLFAKAAERSQLWITTHSERLAELLASETGAVVTTLQKIDGATVIASS